MIKDTLGLAEKRQIEHEFLKLSRIPQLTNIIFLSRRKLNQRSSLISVLLKISKLEILRLASGIPSSSLGSFEV